MIKQNQVLEDSTGDKGYLMNARFFSPTLQNIGKLPWQTHSERTFGTALWDLIVFSVDKKSPLFTSCLLKAAQRMYVGPSMAHLEDNDAILPEDASEFG